MEKYKTADVKAKGEVHMRKIMAAAALTAALALLLCACGGPSQPMGSTTADGLTEQQAPAASKKAAVPAAAGTGTTAAATTAATTQPQTTTAAQTTTAQATTTTAVTTAATQPVTAAPVISVARTVTVTMPAERTQPFVGVKIVLAGPGRWIDENINKEPHTVYAIDLGGRRFCFQPRAYSPGGSFAIDVYRDNFDGTYTWVDALESGVNNGGNYSIVLLTPDSAVTRDAQGLIGISNVHRFEYSVPNTRYCVFPHADHTASALTAYYALDMDKLAAGVIRFSPISPATRYGG